MATGPTPSLGNHVMHDISPATMDYYDARSSCKLRRQQPVKRESSRRILVRPVVQRRREPSISSSCESLDELRPPMHHIPIEQVFKYFILNFKTNIVCFCFSQIIIINLYHLHHQHH
jgi:hypothetical protein